MTARRAWITSVLGYTVVRAILAWGLFQDFGVNPWVFALLDIGTAVPYAKAIGKLPTAIATAARNDIVRSGVIAVASFLTPYAYIFVVAREAPTGLLSGIAVLVVCLGGAASLGVIRRSRTSASKPNCEEGIH